MCISQSNFSINFISCFLLNWPHTHTHIHTHTIDLHSCASKMIYLLNKIFFLRIRSTGRPQIFEIYIDMGRTQCNTKIFQISHHYEQNIQNFLLSQSKLSLISFSALSALSIQRCCFVCSEVIAPSTTAISKKQISIW